LIEAFAKDKSRLEMEVNDLQQILSEKETAHKRTAEGIIML